MITIDTQRCTGCGACVEVCPTSALYLVDGKAVLDASLCRGCEACLAVCPSGAILEAVQAEAVAETAQLPVPTGEPSVIKVRAVPGPVPFRSKALPVIGTALAWAGRQILPRLADVLGALDRQDAEQRAIGGASGRQSSDRAGQGRGQQHRRRQRGGRA